MVIGLVSTKHNFNEPIISHHPLLGSDSEYGSTGQGWLVQRDTLRV